MCRVNRFRVKANFVRDPDKFQILSITVSCKAFDGGYITCLLKHSQASEVQKIFLYYKQKQKISVLLTEHFVIDECKLCNKEWKPLAIV